MGWEQRNTWDSGVWGRANSWASRALAVHCGFFLFFLSVCLSSPTPVFEPMLSQTGSFPKHFSQTGWNSDFRWRLSPAVCDCDSPLLPSFSPVSLSLGTHTCLEVSSCYCKCTGSAEQPETRILYPSPRPVSDLVLLLTVLQHLCC